MGCTPIKSQITYPLSLHQISEANFCNISIGNKLGLGNNMGKSYHDLHQIPWRIHRICNLRVQQTPNYNTDVSTTLYSITHILWCKDIHDAPHSFCKTPLVRNCKWGLFLRITRKTIYLAHWSNKNSSIPHIRILQMCFQSNSSTHRLSKEKAWQSLHLWVPWRGIETESV